MFGRRGEIEKLVAQLEQQRSRLEQVRERQEAGPDPRASA